MQSSYVNKEIGVERFVYFLASLPTAPRFPHKF